MSENKFKAEKLSVMVVEQNETKRSHIVNILKNIGFIKIELAIDGIVALRILKRRPKPVDIIISNKKLPQINGLLFLKILSADELLFKIPYILITRDIDKELVIEAGKWGVASIMIEPITREQLEERLKSIISGGDYTKKVETEKLLQMGHRLINEGKYDKALSMFKEILDIHEDAEVYFNIGYIKTIQKKFDEAIIAFRRAVMINNFHASAFKNMGAAYEKKGNQEEAQRCYEKAGEIFLQQNKDHEAEEVFKEALNINPDTLNVYNSLGIIYRKQKNYKEAIVQYQKGLKVDPEDENIWFNLGRAFLDNKKPLDAKRAFEKALSLNMNFTDAREMLNKLDKALSPQ